MQKRFGQNTVILLRMHNLINKNFNFVKYDGFAIQVIIVHILKNYT
ncbi:hypothetical protein [Bacillus atrophaeus]|nr:hypothetical protein [Bacillus atrophaeus]MCY8826924.1 CDP-glycerol glycerophosphotransferase family protein [Bacillus atrophaeus]MCY8842716.1 CDP-glycerol glycerophosphotransferase family protein [Bacillus atrophaeus]MEC0805968.1 hypothetical protein [Bacillus atrophaeus]MEC0854044.1 hypothetical protein [Bacillus atrophaeus]MEC0856985.1 hypothetical protein [Bacillus atrophaeus]